MAGYQMLLADALRPQGVQVLLTDQQRREGIEDAFAPYIDLSAYKNGIYRIYRHYDNFDKRTQLYAKCEHLFS